MAKKLITPEQAISFLHNEELIHTFRSAGGLLIGSDWRRDILIEKLNEYPDKIEIAGEMARKMNHGIAFEYNGHLFIECDIEKLNEFDPI